jgi:hypothetical protein
MAGEQATHSDGSFIVRIWWEHGAAGDTASPQAGHWRGRIQHVGNGEYVYFTSMRDLTEFIERETGIPPERSQPVGLV